jgi:hypothetical protein
LRVRADAIFTASADKRGRARTSGRKGRPDGHFHPKTSFMTSLDPKLRGKEFAPPTRLVHLLQQFHPVRKVTRDQ